MKQRASSPFLAFIRRLPPRLRVSASPRLLARAQARFLRSRPGSVLILVVALLVLMALIGTAFMSMAQTDRATSVQHENNTEIDLLVEGLINVVKGAVAQDLFSSGLFRAGANYSTDAPATYNNITGVGYDLPTAKQLTAGNPTAPPVSAATPFVASRVPELLLETSPTGGPITNGTANPAPGGMMPFWRFVTAPLIGGSFASPMAPIGPNTQFLDGQANPPANDRSNSYTQRAYSPSRAQPLYPWYINVNGINMPAWVDNPTAPPNVQHAILAADADGDGVADSGLIKLPVGAINGLTYYGAVRVVDNTAAVNANVAWTHNALFSITGYAAPQLPGDFFPNNIDLTGQFGFESQGLLVGSDATTGMTALNNYRANGATLSSATPYFPAQFTATDDSGNARTDFFFNSPFELEWTQFGRRVKNPGFITGNTPFRSLPLSESLSLANGFILRTSTPGSATGLEQLFPLSLFDNPVNDVPAVNLPIPTSPYSASAASPAGATLFQWYQANFAFLSREYAVGPGNPVPLRSILTAENGVGNFAPTKFTDLGTYDPNNLPPSGFQFGDMVSYPDNKGNLHRFVCINGNQATANFQAGNTSPPGPTPTQLRDFSYAVSSPPSGSAPVSSAWNLDSDTWVYEPWTTSPTKINVNTATFGQLWLAYYEVMADQLSLFPNVRTWAPAFPTLTSAVSAGSARMFRSPLRYQPTVAPARPIGLSPTQVMQLRAALAAVNTIDMRDSDDNVTSRTVHLVDSSPNVAPLLRDVTATVYGMERQPFITQVYATDLQYTDTSNVVHNGFVAIELYNPYPVAIDLSNYTLAYANRTSATITSASQMNLTFTPIPWAGTSMDPSTPKTPPVIAPFSSIIIASAGTGTSPDPTLPPTGSGAAGTANLAFPGNVIPAVTPWVQPTTPPPPPPSTPTIYLYVVSGLCPQTGHAALGNELYLFRGRLDNPGSTGNGVGPIKSASTSYWPSIPTPSTQPTTPPPQAGTTATSHYEGTLTAMNPSDMVPVDSYDFSTLGANAFTTTAGGANEWYYVRPNPMGGGFGKGWHFVYPGHIAMSAGVTVNQNPVPRFIDGTVYSGGLDPSAPAPPGGGPATTIQAGIGKALAAAKNVQGTAFTTNFQIPLGAASPAFSVQANAANPIYQDIPLELNSPDFGGPNAGYDPISGTGRASTPTEQGKPAFPFGGFARNGDILEVPYIGAYRLMIPPPNGGPTMQIIEMNPPTMDSVMALGLVQPEWRETAGTIDPTTAVNANGADPIHGFAVGGVNNTAIEQVGRFCPIGPEDFTGIGMTYTPQPNDYALPLPGAVGPPNSPNWLYHWSTRLFDYLTVQSPQIDLLPEVDPGKTDPANPVIPQTPPGGQAWAYGPSNPENPNYYPNAPKPVANVNPNIANAELNNQSGATEETGTIQGLININTAPWRVLATVPWVPPGYPNHALDNANIALSIVYYRDVNDGSGATPTHGHGPFKSIFELNGVPIYSPIPDPDIVSPGPTHTFRNFFLDNLNNTVNPNPPLIPSAEQGDLTAAYPANTNGSGRNVGNNGALGDFKGQYLMINRVSNLITTRSDSFTAYILLQGWRNAESTNATTPPTLAVQRRAAFLIDRSGVTPINNSPTITFVPNQ